MLILNEKLKRKVIMGIVEELREDCRKLHEKYWELHPRDCDLPTNMEEVRVQERGSFCSGKLIVDFYEERFVPKYSESSEDVVVDAGNLLGGLASMATRAMDSENYVDLGVLLLDEGSCEDGPDRLEVLIRELDKVIGAKEK